LRDSDWDGTVWRALGTVKERGVRWNRWRDFHCVALLRGKREIPVNWEAQDESGLTSRANRVAIAKLLHLSARGEA
jgi:hypothetical protein